MANWKKMAEAFGRAMATRKGNGPAADAIAKSETLKFKTNGKSPEERAYLHGHETEGPDEYYVAKERGGDYEDNVDKIEDENSSMRLKQDFDEGFEEAVERHKEERLNEWDWDGENQKSDADAWDYEAAKDREAEAEQQVRDELIQKLKSGMSLSDFFEKYGQRPMD